MVPALLVSQETALRQQEQAEEEMLATAIARSLGQEPSTSSSDVGAGASSSGSATTTSGSAGRGGARGPSTALIEEMLPAMPFEDAKGFLLDGNGAGGVHECSICLAEMRGDERVRVLPCVHCFHSPCIDHWFKRSAASPSCPTCKAPVAIG